MGAFGQLWANINKNNKFTSPSIFEVVMGIYSHLIYKVEETFKELKYVVPKRFKLYRIQQLKTFNYLLFSLELNADDINKPMTRQVYEDPYSR